MGSPCRSKESCRRKATERISFDDRSAIWFEHIVRREMLKKNFRFPRQPHISKQNKRRLAKMGNICISDVLHKEKSVAGSP